jgi:transposase InsO family protein
MIRSWWVVGYSRLTAKERIVGEQTGKHGARLDDKIRQETEGLVRGSGPTRVDGAREPEPVETDTGRDPTSQRLGRGGVPAGTTVPDVERRAAIAKVLAGTRYPTTPNHLAVHAREHGAPYQTVRALETLPDGAYTGLAEVTDALGLGRELRRS